MPTATEIIESYNQCAADINAIKNKRMGRLHDDLKAIFDIFDDVRSIVLQGYTPSFNDGDPCTHRDCDPIINGNERWDEGFSEQDKEVLVILEAMSDAITDMYDTNFQVTVTRCDGGVTIEDDYYSL